MCYLKAINIINIVKIFHLLKCKNNLVIFIINLNYFKYFLFIIYNYKIYEKFNLLI